MSRFNEIGKEIYVTFECAKSLTQLGFDWGCRDVWLSCGDSYFLSPLYGVTFIRTKKGMSNGVIYPAPTLHVATKWLREVKNLHVLPMLNVVCAMYAVRIYELTSNGLFTSTEPKKKFEKYEEALSAGITMAVNRLINER